jgi:hypothetical protein
MSKFETVRFEPNHLKDLILAKHERKTLDINSLLFMASKPTSEVRACYHKGKLLGLGGYFLLWEGVIELFIIPSVYLPEYPKISIAVMEWGIEILKNMQNVHRIQTFTLDEPVRNKFVARFGFKCDGRLPCYTRYKEDYKIWSITRGSESGLWR